MAKFPTDVEGSVTVKVPIEKAYKYLWDVVRSSQCTPGLASCKKVFLMWSISFLVSSSSRSRRLRVPAWGLISSSSLSWRASVSRF